METYVVTCCCKHKIKLRAFRWLLLILLTTCICIPSFSQETDRWDAGKQTFYSPANNIKWDLSDFGEWRIAEKELLPDNCIFCGSIEDICLCILAIESPDNISVTEGADEFINGYIFGMISQSQIFPGIKSGPAKYEECYYMLKKAIRFGSLLQVRDARQGTNSPVPYIYGGYVFQNNKTALIPMALIPYEYIDEYGDIAVEMFFQRLSYINASKQY